MDVYERMARNYDLIYNDDIDLGYYIHEAGIADGPVLEVACGTGRILLRLLSAGIYAEGIDLSGAMLKVLSDKARALGMAPAIHQADMRDFHLGKRFKLIIVPYRSFLHLKDDDERIRALKCFRDHLEEGGRLILHIYRFSEDERMNRHGEGPIGEDKMKAGDGSQYEIRWYLGYDRVSDIAHYRIELISANGEDDVFEMDLHPIPPERLSDLLKRCGFKKIEFRSAFDDGSLDEDTQEVLCHAER